MKKEVTCVCCPLGCALSVEINNGVISVKGNSCKRGEVYGIKEVTNPSRIVTSSVPISFGDYEMLSVKTEKEIPKDKIFDVMKEITLVKVTAPVKIGDVIIENVASTSVNVVATRNVSKI